MISNELVPLSWTTLVHTSISTVHGSGDGLSSDGSTQSAQSLLQADSYLVYFGILISQFSFSFTLTLFGIWFTSLLSILVYFPISLPKSISTVTVVRPLTNWSSLPLSLSPSLPLSHTDKKRRGRGREGKRKKQVAPPSSSSLLTSPFFPAPPFPCWTFCFWQTPHNSLPNILPP